MSVIPGRRARPCWVVCKPNFNTSSCSQPFEMERGRREETESLNTCPVQNIHQATGLVVPAHMTHPSSVGCLAPYGLVMSQIQGSLIVVRSRTWGRCSKTGVVVSLTRWWTAWCVYMAQMVGGGWVPAWKVAKTSLIKWCHMQALMCLCDRTFFFFSSNFVSYCLFFPYCSSSPRLLNSLINFSLACIFFFSSILLVLCLLSSLLSFLYLSISICRHVCGGLSQSPIGAL